MPQYNLSLAAGGFFLYPVGRDGRCPVMAAPRVTGIPHRCFLFIEGAIAATDDVNVVSTPAFHVAELSNCTVSFADLSVGGGGAAVGDLDSIVPFHEVCCGATLKSGWLSDVNVVVAMPPGRLEPHPEASTNVVRWMSCRTRRTKESRFVSSGTTLTTWDEWDGVIRVGSRGSIRFAGGEVKLLLWHAAVPEGLDPVAEDLAHVASMLDLCEPIEQLQLEFGVVLQRGPGDAFDRFGILAKPRINCGGRWIEA